MVELANGCICCSINNDLVDAIFRVLQREPRVDYLIVETTGLADPLPIVLTFLRSEFRDAVRVNAIVAFADAENFSLDRFDSKAGAQPVALRRYRAAEQMRPGRRARGRGGRSKDPHARRGRPDRAHDPRRGSRCR